MYNNINNNIIKYSIISDDLVDIIRLNLVLIDERNGPHPRKVDSFCLQGVALVLVLAHDAPGDARYFIHYCLLQCLFYYL